MQECGTPAPALQSTATNPLFEPVRGSKCSQTHCSVNGSRKNWWFDPSSWTYLVNRPTVIHWPASFNLLPQVMSPDINSLSPTWSTTSSPRQRRLPPTLSDSLSSQHTQPDFPSATLPNMNNGSANNHSNIIATDLPHRPSHSHRSSMSGSERRRSRTGSSSILNNGHNSASDSAPGEPTTTPHDHHRSSFGHNGLRTSSPLSNVGGNPTVATGDPHHQRAPSLGELHQELEQEQEAQVV